MNILAIFQLILQEFSEPHSHDDDVLQKPCYFFIIYIILYASVHCEVFFTIILQEIEAT